MSVGIDLPSGNPTEPGQGSNSTPSVGRMLGRLAIAGSIWLALFTCYWLDSDRLGVAPTTNTRVAAIVMTALGPIATLPSLPRDPLYPAQFALISALSISAAIYWRRFLAARVLGDLSMLWWMGVGAACAAKTLT